MNVHDVIVKDGAVYRILALEDERALCINCSGKTMPKWLPLAELADCPSTKAPAVDEELTRVQRKKAHVRYTLISPILSFLTDEKERRRMIDWIATSNGLSKQTLTARQYVAGIMRRLREHEYNPELMKLYIVGGGGCLIRNFGEYDPSRVTINDDICATAKGYEFLAGLRMKKVGAA